MNNSLALYVNLNLTWTLKMDSDFLGLFVSLLKETSLGKSSFQLFTVIVSLTGTVIWGTARTQASAFPNNACNSISDPLTTCVFGGVAVLLPMTEFTTCFLWY